MNDHKPCPVCHGRGYLGNYFTRQTCRWCGGTGRVAGEKLLLALKQGFVVIVMHNEYALPRFEWAPYLNGRQ